MLKFYLPTRVVPTKTPQNEELGHAKRSLSLSKGTEGRDYGMLCDPAGVGLVRVHYTTDVWSSLRSTLVRS